VRVWCDHVDTSYTWSGITRVVESKEFLVFVRGSGGGPALPKRVLSPGQLAELRDLVRTHSLDRGTRLSDAPKPSRGAT